jgi:1,4-dihydroxy-2-naphthoate octaprenyltransferase
VLSVFYFTNPSFEFALVTVCLTCTYIISIGAFGYFVNDWFDSKADQLSGKSNATSNLPFSLKILIAIILISIGTIPFLLILSESDIYFYLLIIQIALLLLYSVPPIKLKHNVFGIITDSLFSFIIPALISLFIVVQNYSNSVLKNPVFIVLILWLFFLGIRSILIHQLKDFENDLLSKTRTFTVNIGKTHALFLAKWVLLIEVLCFIALVVLVPGEFRNIFIISFAFFLVIEYQNNARKYWLPEGFPDIASKLNVFYNYYLFLGLSIFLSIQISYVYAFFVFVFILIKQRDIYCLLKTIMLFLFYKSKGAIRRVRKLFNK